MEKILLMLITALGMCVAKQFYFVYEPMTMSDAKKYCRTHHTDLATIENMEEVETLNRMVDRSKTSHAWIGLYDDVRSSRWSLSDRSLYADGGVNFTNWAATYPDGDHCAAMKSDGLWYDFSCGSNRRAICSDARGYVLTNDAMMWNEAQKLCRETYTDLASVSSSGENFLVRALVPSGENGAWIGLFRDTWRWTDGSTSSFRYWERDEPNERAACVAAGFNINGQWYDMGCTNTAAFICHGPSKVVNKQVYRLKLRTDVPLDNNDPKVMEQILDRYRQALSEQGMGHVKLSWQKQADGKVFHREEEEEEDPKKRNKVEL